MARTPDLGGATRTRHRPQSRRRSKVRPTFPEAQSGVVIAVDRGRFTCVRPDDPAAQITAVKARALGRKGVVVGDVVGLHGDTSGLMGSLARIISVDPRVTELRRTADDADPTERVIVANVDQMAIVIAAADPPPRLGLIDRCLVAAFAEGIAPVLAVTKVDLCAPDAIIERYEPLGVDVLTTGRDLDFDAIADRFSGHRTVLVGHSGVGKSTLTNALVPRAGRATGAVNDVTGRGRHVSTSIEALPLPEGGWVVDTPGIRSFGLAHVERDRLIAAFVDLAAGTNQCPRGCDHLGPDCALDAWAAAGNARPERLASFRRIVTVVGA